MWRYLVGLVFIGLCAGVYLWTFYDSKVINIIELYTGMGVIFSSIGAIATVFVFRSTAQATKNAIKSVEIAEKNLRESREYNKETLKIAEASLQSSLESSRKDDFIKQFTLLIEQHNKSHEIMMNTLNTYKIGSDKNIKWDMTIKQASENLYLNYKFSPYMRMLFRVLKYCDENFYILGDTHEITKEKKKYTSIVRSMIRNDVLYFVAINSMNERDVFSEYRNKLKKFDFFEHLITDEIGESINFSISDFYDEKTSLFFYYENDINDFISKVIEERLEEAINKEIKCKLFYLNDCVKNKKDILNSFNYKLSFEYVSYQCDSYLADINKLIKYEEVFDFEFNKIVRNINSNSVENKRYFLYSYDDHTDNTYTISEIKEREFDLEYFSDLISKKNISLGNFKKTIDNEFNTDVLFSDKYIEDKCKANKNNFTGIYDIYRSCETYIMNRAKKNIVSKKDTLFEEIINIVISKMNETSLINKSGGEFINQNNKIVLKYLCSKM